MASRSSVADRASESLYCGSSLGMIRVVGSREGGSQCTRGIDMDSKTSFASLGDVRGLVENKDGQPEHKTTGGRHSGLEPRACVAVLLVHF